MHVDIVTIHTWQQRQGRMDVLMELDDSHIEGAMGREFVSRGVCLKQYRL